MDRNKPVENFSLENTSFRKLNVLDLQCFKGALAYRVSSFPKYFVFASLCSFICLQAVYQLSGPVCKATWNGCPSYSASYLHFTLCD